VNEEMFVTSSNNGFVFELKVIYHYICA